VQAGKLLKIDFQPLGKRVDLSEPHTILEAAHQSGIDLVAVCGGGGTCGACKIRLASGELSPVEEAERIELGEAGIQDGFRLACQAIPVSDCRIEIPPESLTALQRTQIDGLAFLVELEPAVEKTSLIIQPPANSDTLPDDKRFLKAVEETGIDTPVQIPFSVLGELSTSIRKENWSGSLVTSRTNPREVISFMPEKSRMLGLAGDLGSTKLALYLIDLETGETLAKVGAMNPQISYGEDIVSRIAYTNKHPDGRKTLQRRLVDTINDLTSDLCIQTGTKPEWIVDCVMVGNTAMHHFFAGLPVEQLGLAPYLAAVGNPLNVFARSVGLMCASGANLFMPPNLAGFVGADHVAMLLAAGSWHGDETILSMDIGTNTEVSLLAHGKLFSCSCASGPAFEGAHIHSGMRAAPGAIERVQIRDGKPIWQTIDGKPPVGICGSGILEAVAELKNAALIDERGVFLKSSPYVDISSGKGKFILVKSGQTANSEEIAISRSDINQIQLAKAAIRAGVEILLMEAGITQLEIDRFILAGAFGTYMDIPHSISIGMFPDIPLERFTQIGNAAGVGACQLLLSTSKRVNAVEIARRMNYVELTVHPHFTQQYFESMYLRKV
jgi:uncharacterized 2Fe-2S/4Fe-4S cluster protein (DUF4445 family)